MRTENQNCLAILLLAFENVDRIMIAKPIHCVVEM